MIAPTDELKRITLRSNLASRASCRFDLLTQAKGLWHPRARANLGTSRNGAVDLMTIWVTGAAGFIGAAVTARLLERGGEVIGIDAMNDYYDVALKRARLERLQSHKNYHHLEFDLCDRSTTEKTFRERKPTHVIHLAAQAGVRYSIEHPHTYGQSNLTAFLNILEGCRAHDVRHLTYASSSSVYGGNTKTPFSERDPVDHPISLYAATKRANELMAHTYSHLYGLPTSGLRFFTVYGPWGRPDMSPFLFVKRILEGTPIDVFNHGDHQRDFTYIDDIVEGVILTNDHPATADASHDAQAPNAATSDAPFRIFNIGCERPVELLRYIEVIEECTGKKAIKNMLPMQPGDVRATYADVSAIADAVGYRPRVPLEEGMKNFVDWYRDYYGN